MSFIVFLKRKKNVFFYNCIVFLHFQIGISYFIFNIIRILYLICSIKFCKYYAYFYRCNHKSDCLKILSSFTDFGNSKSMIPGSSLKNDTYLHNQMRIWCRKCVIRNKNRKKLEKFVK